MESYIIALLGGIGIQGLLFGVSAIKSCCYKGTPGENLQYFTTAQIPLITVVMYSMAALTEPTQTPRILNYFFIEWSITTPCFLIQIVQLLHIRLYKYFLLSIAAVTMNLLGFASHFGPQTIQIMTTTIICACLSYIYICGYLIYLFSRAVSDPLLKRTVGFMLTWILSLWSCYPIAYILYVTGTLSLNATVVFFVILDILTKGLSTISLLQYYNRINHNDRFLQFLRNPRSQIHPEPSIIQLEDR